MKKLRIVTLLALLGFGTGRQCRKGSLHEGQIPNFRGVRVAPVTGSATILFEMLGGRALLSHPSPYSSDSQQTSGGKRRHAQAAEELDLLQECGVLVLLVRLDEQRDAAHVLELDEPALQHAPR